MPMPPISQQVDFGTKRQLFRFNPTAGPLSFTLPKASAFKGWTTVIKNASNSTNAITMLPTLGDTVDGDSQVVIDKARGARIFVSDGVSDWMQVAEYVGL